MRAGGWCASAFGDADHQRRLCCRPTLAGCNPVAAVRGIRQWRLRLFPSRDLSAGQTARHLDRTLVLSLGAPHRQCVTGLFGLTLFRHLGRPRSDGVGCRAGSVTAGGRRARCGLTSSCLVHCVICGVFVRLFMMPWASCADCSRHASPRVPLTLQRFCRGVAGMLIGLVALRALASHYLRLLPTPLGFDPARQKAADLSPAFQHRMGPDPPLAILDAPA